MEEALLSLSPVCLALLLTLGTWFMTAAGSAAVLLLSRPGGRVMDLLTGFGAGVMIASSVWSLLIPALESEERFALPMVCVGFVAGGAFILAADRFFDTVGFEQRFGQVAASRRREGMLILAVTLHNIPEGLSVGVAVGAAALGVKNATAAGAAALAAGIALQNLPEGACVSLPLRREGMHPLRCFFYGQLSGMPEPIAGVLGVLLSMWIGPLLPFFLSFAAGAMIAVVTGELIPACAAAGKGSAVIGVTGGFLVMMLLDVLCSVPA